MEHPLPLLNFGEWRSDVSDYEAATTQNVQNVVPRRRRLQLPSRLPARISTSF
jgi:hypothetical protein